MSPLTARLFRQRYLLATLAAIYILIGAAYYVWTRGFSEKVTYRGGSRLSELSQLWFSDKGDLVGVGQKDDIVLIEPWLGGKPTVPIKINLENLLDTARKLEPSIRRSPNVPAIVSRDVSRFIAAWQGVVVVQDLINGTTEAFRLVNPKELSESNNDYYRPASAEIIALALDEDERLILLWNDRVIEIRDSKRKVIGRVDAAMVDPASLFISRGRLIVTSSTRSKVEIYNPERLAFGPIKELSFNDPRVLSFTVSRDQQIAVANATSEIAYIAPPVETTYTAPGPVWAVNFYDRNERNQLLVGGDFVGIYLISAGTDWKRLAEVPEGVHLLAWRDTDIAFAEADSYVLLSYQGTKELNRYGMNAIALGMAGLVLIPLMLRIINRRMARSVEIQRDVKDIEVRPQPSPTINQFPTNLLIPAPQPKQLPRPTPPPDLVEMCASGDCVLYGGAGLAARASYPTWEVFLLELLEWSIKNNFIDKERAESFRAAIEEGSADSVADSIYYELQRRKELPALQNYLRHIFLRDTPLPDVYRILNEISLAGVLTTNFDNLFERNFEHKGIQVFTPGNAEQLKTSLSKSEFFILKLYGSLSQEEMVMVAPVQYERAVIGNRTFADFMETLFFSKTILFVGSSLKGIEAYLQGITLPEFIPRQHYALIAVEGNAWQAQADVLERQYGIKILPFTPTEGFPEVYEFLEDLVKQVQASTTARHEVSREKARITRVILENIGPFEELELNLNASWNILLGDNGVGKSTILKAIAVAICGKDAQPYATRLIKSGKESGLIVLETDRNTVYETRIFNTNGYGEVRSKPARPLEIENWLVVGFPPLRAASWKRPEGPEGKPKTRSTSSPEDVLPLVRGEVDPRMDRLKQWIVNLDYWKDKNESGDTAKYDEMIQEFFELVDYLTIDLKLKYRGIDKDFGIRVETKDGPIPIEAVSQGTTSLTGWIGILMQRLNEVYGYENDPKSKAAIVLMDEIDAHMHPAWQQLLVSRLSAKFPNLQFIATTHSPLIVGGMPPEQLFRFTRARDGKVVQIPVDPEMTLGRADQVLTGDLFGLETTIDPVTQGFTAEYQELLSMSPDTRSKEQDIKLQKLRETLGFRIPETGETAPERRAQELLRALLLEQFGDQFPEVQERILDRAQQLFAQFAKQEKLRR